LQCSIEDLKSAINLLDSRNYRISYETLNGIVSKYNSLIDIYTKEKNLNVHEIGLTAMVLKNGFFEHQNLNNIEKLIKFNGFRILHIEKLENKKFDIVNGLFRGGIWRQDGNDSHLPHTLIILIDDSIESAYLRKLIPSYNKSIRFKRSIVRQKIGHAGKFIHMSDNTIDTLDYIEKLGIGEALKSSELVLEKEKRSNSTPMIIIIKSLPKVFTIVINLWIGKISDKFY